MKTILVTGASGFIGSHLCEYLKEKSNTYRVVLLTSNPIPGFTCVLHKNYGFSKEELIAIGPIDIVVHLGSFSPKNKADLIDISKNYSTIRNTLYLLDQLPVPPQRILYCSTISVYGDFSNTREINNNIIISENTSPKPSNEYGIAKYCTELLIQEWCSFHHSDCIILRLAPVYGEQDYREQFLYSMIKNVINGKDIIVTSSVKRNLLYIEDCCRFITNAIDVPGTVPVINVVSEYNETILNIGRIISSFSNTSACIFHEDKGDSAGSMEFDCSLRKDVLGKDEIPFNEGLLRCFNYYKTLL